MRLIFLFDLDDTLIAFEEVAEEAWKAVCQEYCGKGHSGIDAIRLLAHIDEVRTWYWSDPERHRLGRKDIYKARREIVRMAFQRIAILPMEDADSLADAYTRKQEELWFPLPGAEETLALLRGRGIRLGLVTNGTTESQRKKLKRFGLEQYFERVYIEEEVGIGKPDRRVFEMALSEMRKQADEPVWMIGDNFAWDIEAAAQVGIRTVWINRRRKRLDADERQCVDIEIDRIGDLLAKGILDGMT